MSRVFKTPFPNSERNLEYLKYYTEYIIDKNDKAESLEILTILGILQRESSNRLILISAAFCEKA